MEREIDSAKEEASEQAKPSPEEERAASNGWRPKEEWNGPEGQWVSADEFNRRGELFSKINHQGKVIENLQKDLGAMAQYNQRIEKLQYERAMADLKAKKAEALESGDSKTVVDIDEKITDLRVAKETAAIVPQQNGPSPEFKDWAEKNDWYGSDQELTEYADDIGDIFKAKHPNASNSEMFERVDKMIKKTFPERFKEPSKRADPVEGGSFKAAPAGNGKLTEAMLSDEEKSVMRNLIKAGVITKEKYLKDLADVR